MIKKSMVKIRIYKKNKPRKSWITAGIIKSCRTKEKLYNNWKKDVTNCELKLKYTNYRKVLDKLIKSAKFNYERNEVNNRCCNSRKMWQYINEKIGKNVKNNDEVDYLIKEGRKVSDTQEVANEFVDFFSNIGTNLASKIGNNRVGSDNISQNAKSIFLKPTDSREIEKTINNLKDKAGGSDGINTKVLKVISQHISKPLEYIFNKCISTGIWPQALKCAEIIPIFKSGDKHLATNYRPISLISNIAKVLEKIIHERIYNFVTDCNLIADEQFGFLKNKGTKDALASISDFIYSNIDKNNPTLIAFLDLAKAFDTVDHKILLGKLYKYGIRGIAYDLIKNYLTDRLQHAKINSVKSNSRKVKIGVPQGTILGPLLFILYINDIFDILPKDSIAAYADDTVIKCVGKTWIEVQQKMKVYLDEVGKWLYDNYLTLNIDKTSYITFGCYRDSVPTNFDLSIYNQTINRVSSCKYLGLIFDCNMKWDLHVKDLIKKTKFFLFIFHKLKWIVDKKTLKIIYNALFESIINYGIIAWGGCYKNAITKLVAIQNKLINVINEQNTFKILGVKDHFVTESLCYHYIKCKNLYSNYQGKTRGRAISVPKVNKNIACKNSYIVAIKNYNNLPDNLKNLHLSKKAIGIKIRNWLLSQK